MDAAEAGDTVAWRRRKAFRRPEILAAARTLIEEEGAAAVSMARIAKAAGVSEATVYKYFENKQDLVNHILDEWAAPFVDRLAEELAGLTGLRDRLLVIAVRFLRAMDETPKLLRVYYQELRWSDYRGSGLHKLNSRFARSVSDAIRDAIARGEVADCDPAMVRDMLFGGLEHIGMRTSFAGRRIEVEKEAARYVDLMLGGLLRPVRPPAPSDIDRLAGLVDRIEAAVTRPAG